MGKIMKKSDIITLLPQARHSVAGRLGRIKRKVQSIAEADARLAELDKLKTETIPALQYLAANVRDIPIEFRNMNNPIPNAPVSRGSVYMGDKLEFFFENKAVSKLVTAHADSVLKKDRWFLHTPYNEQTPHGYCYYFPSFEELLDSYASQRTMAAQSAQQAIPQSNWDALTAYERPITARDNAAYLVKLEELVLKAISGTIAETVAQIKADAPALIETRRLLVEREILYNVQRQLEDADAAKALLFSDFDIQRPVSVAPRKRVAHKTGSPLNDIAVRKSAPTSHARKLAKHSP